MTSMYLEKRVAAAVVLLFCSPLLALAAALAIATQTSSGNVSGQQAAPVAPDDLTRIYYADATNHAVPLPFETGIVPMDLSLTAESDKLSGAELKGSRAATVLPNNTPRFYVFVNEKMNPPPHQLVILKSTKDMRQFTVMVEKGRKGFMPVVTEQVKLEYRVLERLSVRIAKGRTMFVNYVEIRPTRPLAPGEYAIVGNAISFLATFRVE